MKTNIDHPILKGFFLTQLIVLAIGSAGVAYYDFQTFSANCGATPATHDFYICVPDYQVDPTSFIYSMLLATLALSALWAWLENKYELSINLSQISLIALSLILGAMFAVGYSLIPLPILYFVTRYKQQIIKNLKPLANHHIIKRLFFLQLVLAILIPVAPLAYLLMYPQSLFNPTLFGPIMTLGAVSGGISWLVKKRPLSVLFSQISLGALALLNTWDLNSALLLIHQNIQNGISYGSLFPIPFYVWLELLAPIIVPLIILALVTRYKKQIIES